MAGANDYDFDFDSFFICFRSALQMVTPLKKHMVALFFQLVESCGEYFKSCIEYCVKRKPFVLFYINLRKSYLKKKLFFLL